MYAGFKGRSLDYHLYCILSPMNVQNKHNPHVAILVGIELHVRMVFITPILPLGSSSCTDRKSVV